MSRQAELRDSVPDEADIERRYAGIRPLIPSSTGEALAYSLPTGLDLDSSVRSMPGFHAVGDTIGAHYARLEIALRGETRGSMNETLSCLSGIPGRKMRWTLKMYRLYVFLALRLKLVGWPTDIPFMNLSQITGFDRISRIATLWASGQMHFEPVTDEEHRAALNNPLTCAPAPLHFGIAPYLGRSDIKKRKYRPKKDPLDLRQGRYVRNGPKSARWVSQMAERRADMGM
ncbi:hypothetical protein GSI_10099 [Ganoderma sinense ZZ0214-1]|uniref:Uncharacterized protein n=1 Tax=Ganoderma sinense ZZ0214-1 TaxID=1077348 RepID=A0A2G8RZL3_9APHY|nr:hypothetical protein GSI_10099 [Ganoderma sinense ZZ0214-1]